MASPIGSPSENKPFTQEQKSSLLNEMNELENKINFLKNKIKCIPTEDWGYMSYRELVEGGLSDYEIEQLKVKTIDTFNKDIKQHHARIRQISQILSTNSFPEEA